MKLFLPCALVALSLPRLAPGEEISSDAFAYPSVEEEASLPGEGPLRRYEGLVKRWPEFRRRWAGRVEEDRGAIVFLGDSITQGWGADFRGLFPGLKLANRGIGGDTTRGMLIRLEDDVLALEPEAVVMLLGTNDIEIDLPPAVIGRNFEAIHRTMREHDEELPIVLCLVFPSSPEKDRPRDTIVEVNSLYRDVVDGDPHVTVVDTWSLFAAGDGNADPKWFRDLLHLNPEGYARWARALRPVLGSLAGQAPLRRHENAQRRRTVPLDFASTRNE